MSSGGLGQRGGSRPQEAQRRQRVEEEQLVDGVVVDLGHRTEGHDPGGVDHAAQPPVGLHCGLHGARRTVGGGEVDRGDRGTVQAEVAQGRLVPSDQRELGPGVGQALADQAAEAAGGPCHQDGAAGQVDRGLGGHAPRSHGRNPTAPRLRGSGSSGLGAVTDVPASSA